MQLGAWAVELIRARASRTADARTTINYAGKPRLSNQPLFVQLSRVWQITPTCSLPRMRRCSTHGMGACGSPMLSGMTDLHRELERRVAKFLEREDAMLFNSGFGGALGTISGLLRKSDVAILDNRSHLSLA